jgi:hypothetical protein
MSVVGDFRTDLERSIDQVIEQYAVTDSRLKEIEDGQISVLNAMYGVDFDKCSDHWCFRSAKVKEAARIPKLSIINYLREIMTPGTPLDYDALQH